VPQPLAVLLHPQLDKVRLRVRIDRCLQNRGGQFGQAGVGGVRVPSRYDGRGTGGEGPLSVLQQWRKLNRKFAQIRDNDALHTALSRQRHEAV
jgi:hypothetical protein